MKIVLASNSECTGCGACVSVCPQGCISMVEDKEGFLQPKIDQSKCIECHKCEKTCPILNPPIIPLGFETQAFAVINMDESIRMRSSSGGMFHALAKWTIERGGVVFGARFDESWDVIHDYTETIEGVEPFMRSKYVQSRIGDAFEQAKRFLQEGRWVLFSGTPCQIGGFLSFLGKKYEKLICVDLICHGVPSPSVWRKYLRDSIGCGFIRSINFRDKSDGWISQKCVVTITTSFAEIQAKILDNPYYRGFRKDIYLRHSCYHCRYRNYHRGSDFTIADYWGVEKSCPEMFDNKGTSIVFVHTENAREILESMGSLLLLKKQDKDDAIRWNRGMDIENPKCSPTTRFFFFAVLRMSTFPCAIKVMDSMVKAESAYIKYTGKVVRKIKRMVS